MVLTLTTYKWQSRYLIFLANHLFLKPVAQRSKFYAGFSNNHVFTLFFVFAVSLSIKIFYKFDISGIFKC